MPMFRSIKRQLVALVALPLAALVAIAAVTGSLTWDRRLEAERRANLEVARGVAAAFQTYAEGTREQLAALGEAIRLANRPEQVTSLLSEAARRRASVRSISWASPDGRILQSSEARAVGLSMSDRAYFAALVGGAEWAVGNLVPTKVDGALAFGIAESVRARDGRLLGAVIATVDAERLDERVLRAQRPGDAGIALVDQTGRLVMRMPVVDLTWDQRDLTSVDLVRRALAGNEASGDTVSMATGEPYIGAAVPIRPFGWVARAGRSRTEALGPIARDLAGGLGFGLVAAAIALAATAYGGQRLVAGLRRLEAHADALGHGERPRRAPEGAEELDRLGRAFDEMAARLLAAREAEARLAADVERERARFEDAFQAAPAGILILDGEGRVRWANAAYLGFLDEPHRSRGVVGQRFHEFLPAAIAANVEGIVARVAADGRPHEAPEFRVDGFARGTAWFRWSLRRIPAAEGGGPDLLLLATDVTDTVVARHAAEEAVRHRDEVLAVVSHDLRTPLTTVSMGASALESTAERGELARERVLTTAHRIRLAGERMARMVNDLLDLAALEQGRLALRPAPVAPAELARDAADEARPVAQAKGLELGWDADADLPAVRCDAGRILQVLGNLVSNAVKAADAGFVVVRVARAGPDVRFEVADSGPGIPENDLPHVFDRFRRGRTAAYRGTGLGLAIARALVEAHGGRIWAESRMGAGTRVFFTLPALEVAPAAVGASA